MQTDSHLIAGLRMVHLAALPPTADRDGAMRGLAMVSWLGLMLLAAPAVAGDCEDWHAERFFARATLLECWCRSQRAERNRCHRPASGGLDLS